MIISIDILLYRIKLYRIILISNIVSLGMRIDIVLNRDESSDLHP